MTEEFEGLRPLLFAIAYRILGSVREAEDAVQANAGRDVPSSSSLPSSTSRYSLSVRHRIRTGCQRASGYLD